MKSKLEKWNPDETKPSGEEESALRRGVEVLRVIARERHPVGNTVISEKTGIPKATVSRLTSTLVAAGLVQQADESEKFQLAVGILEFSSAYLARVDLRSVVRPHLARLADESGTGVVLARRDQLDMVVVDSL